MRAPNDAFAPPTFSTASYPLIRPDSRLDAKQQPPARLPTWGFAGRSLRRLLSSHCPGGSNCQRTQPEKDKGRGKFEGGGAETLYRLANKQLCSHHPSLSDIRLVHRTSSVSPASLFYLTCCLQLPQLATLGRLSINHWLSALPQPAHPRTSPSNNSTSTAYTILSSRLRGVSGLFIFRESSSGPGA